MPCSKLLILVLLMIGNLTFAGPTSREPLFVEAFNGLPFFVYAVAGRLDPDFYTNRRVSGFSEAENKMLLQLFRVLIQHHGTDYQMEFPHERFRQSFFDLRDGQEERTAVTDHTSRGTIYINRARINDPKASIDFIDAIQLMLHEVSKKIANIDQGAFDSLASKLAENLRGSYFTFKVNEDRKVHILTIDRPNRYEMGAYADMKVFWFDRQGYEVTTFDEANGYFRQIEEIRHRFANPELMFAYNISSDKKFHALSRNNIIGVEVDRYEDGTTMVRVVADQIQTLIRTDGLPMDLGPSQALREFAITLKGNEPPKISRRQGYLINPDSTGQLTSFEVKDLVLKGAGYLPYRLGDMKDLQLYLIVRTSDSLLNIPLKITSTDLEGPVVFSFERKIAEPQNRLTLTASDIIVSSDVVTPLNRVSLAQSKTVTLEPSKELQPRFDLSTALAKNQNGWASIRGQDAKVDLGDIPFRFIFQSDTLLQEMTLYIQHSKQVYDPEQLKQRHSNALRSQSVKVRPGVFDTSISEEVEYDVFRFDASRMKQRFNRGKLEVEIVLPLRESTVLQSSVGPYTINTGGFGLFGYAQTIQSEINYGVDDEGQKKITKVVAINEGFQRISIEGPQLGVKVSGKKGNYMTPQTWKERKSHYALTPDQESNNCKDKF